MRQPRSECFGCLSAQLLYVVADQPVKQLFGLLLPGAAEGTVRQLNGTQIMFQNAVDETAGGVDAEACFGLCAQFQNCFAVETVRAADKGM